MQEDGPGDPPLFASLLRREARELVRLIEESGLSELLVEEGETRIHLRRTEMPATGAEPVVAGSVEELAPPPLFQVTAPVVGRFSVAGDSGEPLLQ